MTITVKLTNDELAQVKQMTKVDTDAEAVGEAVREFIHLRRLRELKALSGKVEFDDNWQEIESRELGEHGFPQ